jgi:hypothetical protein
MNYKKPTRYPSLLPSQSQYSGTLFCQTQIFEGGMDIYPGGNKLESIASTSSCSRGSSANPTHGDDIGARGMTIAPINFNPTAKDQRSLSKFT